MLTLRKVLLRFIDRLLVRLLKFAGSAGLFGYVGRYCGRIVGCRLTCGYRIVIDNPNEWIQQRILTKGVYEPNVARLLVTILEKGDLFFDVGANIGHHSLVGASRGARVHAFEPVPRIAMRLTDNLRLNHLESQITVREMALSNKEGKAILYIADRGDDGSHSLLPGVEAKGIEPITVTVSTINQYVSETQCGVPTLVKIDVEGFESLVLDGASAALTCPEPPIFIVETGDRLADQLGESASTVLDRFFGRGYRVFRIPQSTGGFLLETNPGHVSGELANYLAIHNKSPKLGSVFDRLS